MSITAGNPVILPGQGCIGILGGGQLGRMTAMAAKTLGYRVVILSPDGPDSPAAQVADACLHAAYTDPESLRHLAEQADVITLEFENIPVGAIEQLALSKPVHPSAEVLGFAQHRLTEKNRLQKLGLPVTPFYPLADRHALETIPSNTLSRLMPGVLKTAGFGYDGKGQHRVKNRFELIAAYEQLGGQPCILEQWADCAMEISVIGARNPTGFAAYGPIENRHRQHILDVSLYPAASPAPVLADRAVSITHELMTALDVTGLLCVEFFITHDKRLLVNETAPRPHNSGHVTMDACQTSQFEQHVRAICGLPLGPTDWLCPAAGMKNLLGDSWQHNASPDWVELWEYAPDAKLHLYGKMEARPGRKMGHINLLGGSRYTVLQQLLKLPGNS